MSPITDDCHHKTDWWREITPIRWCIPVGGGADKQLCSRNDTLAPCCLLQTCVCHRIAAANSSQQPGQVFGHFLSTPKKGKRENLSSKVKKVLLSTNHLVAISFFLVSKRLKLCFKGINLIEPWFKVVSLSVVCVGPATVVIDGAEGRRWSPVTAFKRVKAFLASGGHFDLLETTKLSRNVT